MKFQLDEYINRHSKGYIIETYYNNDYEEYIVGYRSIIPNKEKITTNTLFDIASLTKIFTSTLVYIAYEEELIDIYDFVYDVDSNFVNLKDIKIIDLLSHNQYIWTKGFIADVESKEEFYNVLYTSYVKEKNPTYADIHYIILSILLEKVYKKPYEQLVKEKIINKLDLKSTTFNVNTDDVASNNYQHINEITIDNILPGVLHDIKARKAKKLGIYLGHSSIFSTGKDIIKFLKSFFDYSLLKKETINLMFQRRGTNEYNYNLLSKYFNGKDINEMYDKYLKSNFNLPICKTYNNMGLKYRNNINALNDVPDNSSNNTYVLNGFTGPMISIDFDRKIIIVIMCSVIHDNYLSRQERILTTVKIMNNVYNELINN